MRKDVIVDESKWWNWDESSPKASVENRLLEDQISEPKLSKKFQTKIPQRNRKQPQKIE